MNKARKVILRLFSGTRQQSFDHSHLEKSAIMMCENDNARHILLDLSEDKTKWNPQTARKRVEYINEKLDLAVKSGLVSDQVH